MKLIPLTPKPTKGNKSKFISMYNLGEFLVESKKTKSRFTLVIKEEVTPPVEISKKEDETIIRRV